MKTIVTHGANFHSDDVFAVATLLLVIEQNKDKAKVIRTLEPEKYMQSADYIVDIGRVNDAKKNRFDHHQVGGAGIRPNSVPFASFGLVWKKFGKKLTGLDYAADWIDRQIVQGIDGMDSGMYLYKPVIEDVHPFLFQEYFKSACDVVKGNLDNGNFDKEFMRMVTVAKDVLRVFIIKSKQREVIAKDARAIYKKAKDKRIMIANKFIPTTFGVFKAPEFVEPLVFIYPDLRGGWSAKVVTKSSQSYDSRMKFPAPWRGKSGEELAKITGVDDAKFCHNSGFLAVANSKEGAIEMVRKAIPS